MASKGDEIDTPPLRHKRAIWLLNAAVVIGLPVTNWIYWPAVLEANVLPPEADNVMIAMMGSIILAVLLAPIIAVLTWASLRVR